MGRVSFKGSLQRSQKKLWKKMTKKKESSADGMGTWENEKKKNV